MQQLLANKSCFGYDKEGGLTTFNSSFSHRLKWAPKADLDIDQELMNDV